MDLLGLGGGNTRTLVARPKKKPDILLCVFPYLFV